MIILEAIAGIGMTFVALSVFLVIMEIVNGK
jgi:hypothetical protein